MSRPNHIRRPVAQGLYVIFAIVSACTLVCDAQTAGTKAAARSFRLGNATLDATIATDGDRLGAITLRESRASRTIAAMPEAFRLTLNNGSEIKASDLRLQQVPQTSEVEATPGGAGSRAAGKQLCNALVGERFGLAATWCLVLPTGAHYMRQTLTLQATREDVPIIKVTLLDLPGAEAHVEGTVSGSPARAGQVYFGFEHPLSQMEVKHGVLRAFMARSLPLRAGTSVTYSSVIGLAAAGQMRRDFLAYLERERPRAYSPFLHYNSWYDLGYGNRFDEAGAMDRIHTFGEELVRKRGVKLDSFLFDDGWDDPHSLWEFDRGFPNGFTQTSRAASRYEAGVGVWLSPWGGYEEQKKQRIEYGRSAGYEIVDDGYALSGPRYFEAFQHRCLQMIDQYHVNQFKFDGTGNANHVFPGSLFDSDFEAAIALIVRLRKQAPELFVNLTTGTFPSPFWLRYADSIWRGGEDHSFAGVGTWRQRWITYRDAQTYKNVVRAGPLFPLNSLMLHGILWAHSAEHLATDPGKDFDSEVWSYFGSGTQLQEMYITPSLLRKQDWDTLAKAAKWARANRGVLRDTHWIGGDPEQLAVYGWASWSPGKSIVVLRNPSDKQQIFSLDLQTALELPRGSARRYVSLQVAGAGIVPPIFRADRVQRLSLRPFEVRVLELSPAVEGAQIGLLTPAATGRE